MIVLATFLAAVIQYGATQDCTVQNCLKCPQNRETCTECIPGYGFYPNTSLCAECGINCQSGCKLRGPGTCDVCIPNYGFNSMYSCEACSVFCSAGCNRAGAGKCDSCDPGYGFTTAKACAACSAHCSAGCYIGAGAGKCDRCDPGFGSTATGACDACSAFCSAGCNRAGAGKCDSCDPGYGFTTDKICGACSAHCSAGCSNGTGAGKCDRCDSGFGLTATGTCDACDVNCNNSMGCRTSGTCIQCNHGYDLTSSATCMPSGDSVELTIDPAYGPAAGGTLVTIVAKWTSQNVSIDEVYIGSNLKAFSYQTFGQSVFVKTPSITDLSLVNQPLPVILKMSPNLKNISTGKYFTYKPNPEIYNINPRIVPISGGIRLTIAGNNLGSATHPFVRAVVIIQRNNSSPLSNESLGQCSQPTENETQLICLSPPVYIPDDFLEFLFNSTESTDPYSNDYSRRKREAIFINERLIEDANSLRLRSSSSSKIRSKRSTDAFTNQSYTLPGTEDHMEVYINAVFDGFNIPLDKDGRTFQLTYPPSITCQDRVLFDVKDDTIVIKGANLERCCSKSDYKVRIGNESCDVVQLTDNALTCSPSKVKPQQTDQDKLFCQENYAIFIDVGFKRYQCSCLTYSDKINTKIVIIIATVTVGSFLIIVIAVIVISIIIHKRRLSEKPPTQELTESSLTERNNEEINSEQFTCKHSGQSRQNYDTDIMNQQDYLAANDSDYSKSIYANFS